jgi:16S rRNA (cytosine1402-N4)-methyltransferase
MKLMERPPEKESPHAPVLYQEVLAEFDVPGHVWIVDGTLGYGGHAEGLLERYPNLSVLGVEWDRLSAAG